MNYNLILLEDPDYMIWPILTYGFKLLINIPLLKLIVFITSLKLTFIKKLYFFIIKKYPHIETIKKDRACETNTK